MQSLLEHADHAITQLSTVHRPEQPLRASERQEDIALFGRERPAGDRRRSQLCCSLPPLPQVITTTLTRVYNLAISSGLTLAVQ